MRRAIILVLDGLRRDMISEDLTPTLVRHARSAETFTQHRSVFPSATRVVSSTVATGCYPARHELAGNSLVLIEAGRLVKHDAGHPDFLQHKRRLTGRSLAMPTMAERLRDRGGAII
jgi:predicted AlkP superfamily pyrophosphatase or phosphodiesterase